MNQSTAAGPRHPALYDATTGLPNILLTRELLNRWISLAQRSDRIVAVLDLKVLAVEEGESRTEQRKFQAVTAALQSIIRHSDFSGISEQGTFIVTFGNLFSPGDANRVVTRLMRELRRRTPLEFDEPILTGGISLYPADGTDADSLLLNARSARDAAARKGTGFEFYSQRISQNIVQYTILEDRLLQAVSTGELVARYRPHYRMEGKQIESVEALVYWQHPELGMISPGALVGLAEDLGLSIRVGTFVLEQALLAYGKWTRNSDSSLELLIYTPAPSFIDQRFVSIVTSVLDNAPLAPERLSLGLPESSILQNPEKSSTVLAAFAELGIKLSVFGFGAGHASLTALILYPLHRLTLDSTLVRNGLSDTRARLLVETTMAAAKKLGKPVTASGLQTEEQAAWLRSLGCSRAQGPLFGSPVTAEEIGELLNTGR
ncbi:MAG: GGDEF domain-containing protein [Chromatiaceae bacterium]|nr:GGDEF domain-containing protein [Gammaproteobacteria bacterium]MCB1860267.1 GGDEF domain-containing protein [Gammaproteobacteria bacterium]MCB1879157.1 GGDEF domain-containing protein [Gammaproteobacteria bacterium]MCB1903187.1 GGDEF domain-containing protein [Gammaproteobacteria bacterium]MCP5447514.1 GGDEF domain-containing protein [Chromatiaceae bacterium]